MKAHVFRNPNTADDAPEWVTLSVREGDYIVVLSASWTEAVRVALGRQAIDIDKSSLGMALLHNLPNAASNQQGK